MTRAHARRSSGTAKTRLFRASRSLARVFLTLFVLRVAPAYADPSTVEVTVLTNPAGISFSLEPKAPNLAPPMLELRAGHPLRAWLVPELGVALLVYPEYVGELRIGARLSPWSTATNQAVAGLYVRPGASALLSLSGFDAGPSLELGEILRHDRLHAIIAIGSTYALLHPRWVLELRVGVGATF